MLILEEVLLLIFLVLISKVFAHYLKIIPDSLIQIGLGLLVALLFKVQVPLETDWFLLLFIAPLLFNDGRKFPKQELWKLKGPIFANAIVLVFVTTLLGGYLIYLLVPDIPLYVAFALAAILSPTDPVAVQSIAKQAKLDSNILHLVSGESLINDASGLIGFKYAVAAVTTGYFSIVNATGDFLYTAIVGLISGVVLMLVIEVLHEFLHNQGIQDVIFDVAFRLMAPFIIYMITEEVFHASGVISVVAAGIFNHTRSLQIVDDRPEMNVVSERTWSLVVYLLNGIVFVILGIELPIATADSLKSESYNNFSLFGYVIGAWLILLFIRVGWILVYETFQYFRKRRETISVKSAFLAGLSGVRGAITMAGVLSVPLVIESGQQFPARSLMLFIAAGVIIVSLVVAALFIPIFTKVDFPFETRGSNQDDDEDETDDEDLDDDDEVEQPNYLTEEQAKFFLMQLAVQTIEEHRRDYNQQAAYDLILNYQILMRRLQWSNQTDEVLAKTLEHELELRRVGYEAERHALQRLLEKKVINANDYYQSMKRVDQVEHHLAHDLKDPNIWWTWRKLKTRVAGLMHWFSRWAINRDTDVEKRRTIDIETSKAAIKALSKYVADAKENGQEIDRTSVYHLIVNYRNKIEHSKHPKLKLADKYKLDLELLRFEAVNAQRQGIVQLRDGDRISIATVQKLRQYLNYSENSIIKIADD
ncbi:cation:proton antiporter [Paucilactobacillus nenjiangensis]|uniref:cation:proton antiporter n=1 Tax=Paucilactobacillus nenjiangensis TaxID=1296540 RepID=UPI003BB22477